MGEEEPRGPLPVGSIFLGILAVVLLVVAGFGYFGDEEEGVTITLIVVGGGLGAIAAFAPRIEGVLEFTKEGLKIPVRARRAENQIEQEQVVDGNKVEDVLKALEATLSQFNVSQVGTPTITQGPPRRNVLLVDDAVVTMATLTPRERNLVLDEIARMSHPDFQQESDPRAIRRGDSGRSYRVHKVPDSDIRLWYRQKSEAEPGTLFVMVIEKKDKRS